MLGESANATGVAGRSQTGFGVAGTSTSAIGVAGSAGNSPGAVGVSGAAGTSYGAALPPHPMGVLGTSGNGVGVTGASSSNTGMFGRSTSGAGVSGESSSSYGMYGISTSSDGVYGTSTSATGVHGVGTSSYGVHGSSTSSDGVFGESSGSASDAGVYGLHSGSGRGVEGLCNAGYGVYGRTTTGSGVRGYASDASGYAGYFVGKTHVNGALSKSSGSFKIDHPLDPANKYLSHSFVESPDMMNVYNGNVVADGNGEAVVELPAWFEALNRDFRYQLSCIGGFAPVFVAEKIAGNRFRIAGATPGLEVSWQVTGIRKDRWAQEHPVVVEEDKGDGERGNYLHPELYGLDESASTDAMTRDEAAAASEASAADPQERER